MKKFNFYQVSAIVILIVGFFFSFLIAELNDAPGFFIFGSAAVIGCSSILFGIGEVIKLLEENNKLLKKNIKK